MQTQKDKRCEYFKSGVVKNYSGPHVGLQLVVKILGGVVVLQQASWVGVKLGTAFWFT